MITQLDDYNYFNEYCKMIAADLSKQQALDTDPKALQQINFTENLNRENNQGQNIKDNTIMFFIIEEVEKTILDFHIGL